MNCFDFNFFWYYLIIWPKNNCHTSIGSPNPPLGAGVWDSWHQYDPIEKHCVDGPEDSYFQPPKVEEDQTEGEDEAPTHVFPVGPPFPWGLEDLSVLSGYARHVTVPLWTIVDNVSVFIF